MPLYLGAYPYGTQLGGTSGYTNPDEGIPDVLLDVTALSTSANVNSVAEAFGVSESRPAIAVVASAVISGDRAAFEAALDAASTGDPAAQPAGSQPAAIPAIATGATRSAATQKVPAATLPSLKGVTLLQQLSLLGRSDLSTFAAQHGDVLDALVARPPAATAVSGWWAGVPSAKRADLIATAPRVIGNLEGVPYAVRDRANRTSLGQAEKAIRSQLSAGAGRAASDQLNRRLHMLEQVRTAVAAAHGDRVLVGLDPSGTGTAVVVAGDVATADYVTYLVPGMFSSVDTQIATWSAGAARIEADQQKWLARLTPAGAAPKTSAVVAWFGYHAPTTADVATLGPARQAETALASSIEGLRATRGADAPYVSVVAHSYGSTAAMLALQDDATSVDALVVVGSPGSPASSVSDLAVRDGNVWAGGAAWDPVADTALFGTAPTSRSFGAHTLGVAGARDPITGRTLAAAQTHTDYFGAGTEALRNIELITLGRGDLALH
jgi:hypothetical protein